MRFGRGGWRAGVAGGLSGVGELLGLGAAFGVPGVDVGGVVGDGGFWPAAAGFAAEFVSCVEAEVFDAATDGSEGFFGWEGEEFVVGYGFADGDGGAWAEEFWEG